MNLLIILKNKYMGFSNIAKDILDKNEYELEQSFSRLMRLNPRYKNLDSEDKEILLNLIKKYKEKIRKGNYPTALTIRRDTYNLYSNRVKMGLTYVDIEQIREILNNFKK